MFALTINAYIKNLTSLKAILEKAKVWQADMKISDETIMTARLALDQFTLAQQVRMTTNFAKNAGKELCGVDAPVFKDEEKTLDDLLERITSVLTFLSTLTESMMKDDLDTRMVPFTWVPGKGFTARYYLEVYCLKNFYFHYTTAYSILRHYGLAIGKQDYTGGIELHDLK